MVAVGMMVLTSPHGSAQPAPKFNEVGVVHFGEIGDPTQWPLSAIGTVLVIWGIERIV